jgi:hypothetical protein
MTEMVDFIEAMEELMREIYAYLALIDGVND